MHPSPRLGKYELLRLLGGRTAEVYLARDSRLGRIVAVKVLATAADAEAKARFAAEGRLLAALSHENIVKFYEYDEQDGRPYLVVEYLDGESLQDAIRGGRTGGLSDKLRIARTIAGALEYVHGRGIIHRDVKPDNVRICASSAVKLMDFGIAKTAEFALTGPGFTVGTPYYMAPEQIRGEKLTPRVDVYGFGILLYEMFTGAKPFEGHSVDEIFDLVLHRAVDLAPLSKLGVPTDVCELIRRATEKDPDARPRDFGAVGRMIEGACPGEK